MALVFFTSKIIHVINILYYLVNIKYYYIIIIMANQKCIVDNFGGATHPYSFCIKPIDEMIDQDKIKRQSGGFNMVGITEGAAGLVNYASSLVKDPSTAISSTCGGVLGNKYVLKTELKCKNLNENVHSYINNITEFNIITQREDSNVGIVPAAMGSALQINALPILKALVDDPKQNCMKVELPCHIVDKDSKTRFSGDSPTVAITVSAYDELVGNNIITPSDAQRRERQVIEDSIYKEKKDPFTNLHESIHTYLDDNPELLNMKQNNFYDNNNLDDIDNSNNVDNDILFNLYYLLLSVFLLFLIFKIINKK